MRSLLKIKLIGLCFFVFSGNTFSKDLRGLKDEVNRTIPGSISQETSANEKRVNEIKRLLGISKPILSPALRSEVHSLKLTNAFRKTSSSLFIRSRFDQASNYLKNQARFGKPIELDPSKFGAEVKAELASLKAEQCLAALSVQGKNTDRRRDIHGHKQGSVNSLVQDFHLYVYQRSKKENFSKKYMIAEHAPFLQKLVAESRKDVFSKLGSLVAIKVEPGEVSKIFFQPRAKQLGEKDEGQKIEQLELSLSMLLSMRSTNDKYFLETQECFYSYVIGMNEIFKIYMELDSRNFLVSGAKRFAGFHYWKDEKRKQHYEKHLELYLDGVKQAKKEYIKKMIGLTKDLIPFLKSKIIGARRAHTLLTDLSLEQQNYLVALMLELAADNIPTEEDILAFNSFRQSLVSKAIKRKQKAAKPYNPLSDEIYADIVYFTQRNRLLYDLMEQLNYEEDNREVTNKIISNIQNRGNDND